MARNSKFLKILDEQAQYLNEAEFVKNREQSELPPSDEEEDFQQEPDQQVPQPEQESEPNDGTNLDGQALFGTILTDLIKSLQYIDREGRNEFGIELSQLGEKASKSEDLADTYSRVEDYMRDLGIKE